MTKKVQKRQKRPKRFREGRKYVGRKNHFVISGMTKKTALYDFYVHNSEMGYKILL